MLIKKGLIICWIFITISTKISAQDIQLTLEMARQSLTEKRYEDAADLFRRVIFFDKASNYDTLSIEGLAVSSFYLQEYDQAAKFFLILHRNSGKSDHYFYYVLSLLSQEKILDAKRAALSIMDSTVRLSTSKSIILGLVEFRLTNFDAARKHLEEVNRLTKADNEQLNRIFERAARIDKKNKITAVLMSGVVPGLGQAYSGHYREGANSLALMSIFSVVYVYSIINFGTVDAIISVLPWFHRYYVGGMNAAAGLVTDYKEDHWAELHNELVTIYGAHID